MDKEINEGITITTEQGLFGRKPVDFRDLGKTGNYFDKDVGDSMYHICRVCNKRLRAGFKKGIHFQWCKNCGLPYSIR